MNKICIDMGHGGKDPGAVGNGIQEKDIALKIGTEVALRLKADYADVEVLCTRTTDTYLELKDRTDKANVWKPDALISIHCSAGGGVGGFESYIYTGATTAERSFQHVLHTEILKQLYPFGVTDRGQKKGNLHMLRETKAQAVLTENLFVDVLQDASRLKRAEVIDALIIGHVNGIAKYLGLKPKQKEPDNTVDVYVNGVNVGKGDVINGVTRVPVRAVSQALGAAVVYNAQARRVDVTTQK